jgi:hypothetical protein
MADPAEAPRMSATQHLGTVEPSSPASPNGPSATHPGEQRDRRLLPRAAIAGDFEDPFSPC